MSKLSIIIPSRNEKDNLKRTLDNIYKQSTGDFEVIVGFNGYPFQDLFYPNLRTFESPVNIGLKPMINKLASMAKGKYLYKSDAHCAFGKGFDEILQENMEDDWIVTPRFKIIKNDWSIQMRDGVEEFYDYFYLCCPFTDKRGLRFKAGGHWTERTKERNPENPEVKAWSLNTGIDLSIDETPQMHGSGWFVNKDYFFNELGGFPETDPLGHAQEPIWLGLKNWLIGGKLMVNKKTWYAHLHQNSKDRGYPEDKAHTERTYNETASYWLKQPKFATFIERFYPMPTWPENWREVLRDWRAKNG